MATATDTRSASTAQRESAQSGTDPRLARQLLRLSKALLDELRHGAATVLAAAGAWAAVLLLL
jgi:hypothetical protein